MKEQTVLVVDDDENMIELISLYLRREGYSVLSARDGAEAVRLHSSCAPDLIILDIMLPEMDGWEVCKTLRRDAETPVIMLTARRDDYDKVLGLELGADDYVTKPFNPRELMARVRAVLRRSPAPENETDSGTVQLADLRVNRDTWTCRVDEREIPLTAKEFELLWLLVKNPRRVFTREQILQRVWGYDYTGDTRTVDTHIKKLRRKLEGGGGGDSWRIATVWGVGYRFEVDR